MCHWTPQMYSVLAWQIASKSVEGFEQGARMYDRRQTERPRYGEMCRNRQNRLRYKSDSA